MKQLVLMGVLLFISLITNAQWMTNNQPDAIRGVLYDKNTNLKIEAAMITVETNSTTLSTMTDADGYFLIKGLPKEGVTIKISMPGYEEKVISNFSHFDDVEFYIGLDQKKVKHQI